MLLKSVGNAQKALKHNREDKVRQIQSQEFYGHSAHTSSGLF